MKKKIITLLIVSIISVFSIACVDNTKTNDVSTESADTFNTQTEEKTIPEYNFEDLLAEIENCLSGVKEDTKYWTEEEMYSENNDDYQIYSEQYMELIETKMRNAGLPVNETIIVRGICTEFYSNEEMQAFYLSDRIVNVNINWNWIFCFRDEKDYSVIKLEDTLKVQGTLVAASYARMDNCIVLSGSSTETESY